MIHNLIGWDTFVDPDVMLDSCTHQSALSVDRGNSLVPAIDRPTGPRRPRHSSAAKDVLNNLFVTEFTGCVTRLLPYDARVGSAY